MVVAPANTAPVFVAPDGTSRRFVRWLGAALATLAAAYICLTAASLLGVPWVPHLDLPGVGSLAPGEPVTVSTKLGPTARPLSFNPSARANASSSGPVTAGDGSTASTPAGSHRGSGAAGNGDGHSSTNAPGNSGSSPGHSGTTPGQSGATPGNSGSAPGHTGTGNGNSGTAPGHSGTGNGNSGSAPGHAAGGNHSPSAGNSHR